MIAVTSVCKSAFLFVCLMWLFNLQDFKLYCCSVLFCSVLFFCFEENAGIALWIINRNVLWWGGECFWSSPLCNQHVFVFHFLINNETSSVNLQDYLRKTLHSSAKAELETQLFQKLRSTCVATCKLLCPIRVKLNIGCINSCDESLQVETCAAGW